VRTSNLTQDTIAFQVILEIMVISLMEGYTPQRVIPNSLRNCAVPNYNNKLFLNVYTFQNDTGYISSPRVLSSVARILDTVNPCCLSFCIAAYVTASFVWLDSIRDIKEWYLVSCNTR
jgi:hypothetical protein